MIFKDCVWSTLGKSCFIGLLKVHHFQRRFCIIALISDPSVLELWLKVAKPGGLISFTHKTSVWPEWEPEQDRLETQAQWKKVWVSHPIPYLPSLKEQRGDEPCKEMAKVYIYKKL